jgi:uncharacterized repeat protein (TIGR01451 family)
MSGGGLAFMCTSAELLHTTLAGNRDGFGHGIFVSHCDPWGFSPDYSNVTLTNTILASHTTGIHVLWGNTARLEATVWGGSAWANDTDWEGSGEIFTGTFNYWGNPAFRDPDARDYHIGPTSAAIDRGIDANVDVDIDGESRPQGSGHDIGADEFSFSPSLMVTKHAERDTVQAGTPLTYTIKVTNTGDIGLHAIITDTLPISVTSGKTSGGTLIVPGGAITWTANITTPGGVWMEQLLVTVTEGYSGTLTNTVRVATTEGATGVYTATSQARTKPPGSKPSEYLIYLPLVLRDH